MFCNKLYVQYNQQADIPLEVQLRSSMLLLSWCRSGKTEKGGTWPPCAICFSCLLQHTWHSLTEIQQDFLSIHVFISIHKWCRYWSIWTFITICYAKAKLLFFQVHIFSCTLLGSYAFIVPFAFYFGSSLTYIVINVLGLVTVQHYADTVGYPPFQVCGE